jgi:3-oxoacyl-[acyl-carrier-protein] synthase I
VTPCYIADMGIVCALGGSPAAVLAHLQNGSYPQFQEAPPLLTGRTSVMASVNAPLPAIQPELREYASRNMSLLLCAAEQMRVRLDDIVRDVGAHRVGVVLGTSTSGIGEGERAYAAYHATGKMPPHFSYRQQEMGVPAPVLARSLGLCGPAYTISTACSSGAKAIAHAQRLLMAGVVDAVIAGGADSLCELTLNGFDALESLSPTRCMPCAQERSGINIGEGAALVLLTRLQNGSNIALLGCGESSDGYHMSAPDPTGRGAELAIRQALAQAALAPGDVGYINMHGTATRKNDEMECAVISRIFGQQVPCSSTKNLTGHTLGASGAIEFIICALLLSSANERRQLPLQGISGCGGLDEILAPIRHVSDVDYLEKPICASVSFAFGGSNVCLILGASA